MSFKTSSLASLSSLITKGTTPTTLGYAHSDSGIPFLRVQNIFSGQVNFKEDTLFIDSNTHTALKRSQIQGGDVLVTIAGTIGRTGVVPHDAPEMNCNQAVAIVRPTQEIERSYLRHWLESQEARSQMLGSTVTGTISNLSLSQLGELRVPLPPLDEQRRIAAILDQAETLRTQRRTALALQGSLTQSLFLDMFGDPAKNTLGLPTKQLGELGDWHSGGTPPRSKSHYFEGDIPWFSSGELESMYVLDSVEHISDAALKETATKLVPAGSLMMGMYDTAALKTSIALNDCSCNQAIAFSKLDPTLADTAYVYYAIVVGREHFRRLQRGVRQKNLNLSMVREIRIPHPPLPLQQTFATRIASIEALKTTHRRALAALDALFASLQQRAFAGQL